MQTRTPKFNGAGHSSYQTIHIYGGPEIGKKATATATCLLFIPEKQMRVVLGGLLRPAEGCAQPPAQFEGKSSRCLRGRMKMQRDGRRSQPIGTAIALA
jgi:hypothetical protein